MALVQTDGLISVFGVNLTIGNLAEHHWYTWLVALAVGVALGAVIGGLQGYIVAYVGVPAFIVTLGGFLAWRGMIFRTGGKQGQTLAPLDDTFRYLGGAPERSLGDWKSWVVGAAGVRRHRRQHRPGASTSAPPRSRRPLVRRSTSRSP